MAPALCHSDKARSAKEVSVVCGSVRDAVQRKQIPPCRDAPRRNDKIGINFLLAAALTLVELEMGLLRSLTIFLQTKATAPRMMPLAYRCHQPCPW